MENRETVNYRDTVAQRSTQWNAGLILSLVGTQLIAANDVHKRYVFARRKRMPEVRRLIRAEASPLKRSRVASQLQKNIICLRHWEITSTLKNITHRSKNDCIERLFSFRRFKKLSSRHQPKMRNNHKK